MHVAVDSNSSNTKKQHTLQDFMATKAYYIFERRRRKEAMGFESSYKRTQLLIETLTDGILTFVGSKKTHFEKQNESDQYSLFLPI